MKKLLLITDKTKEGYLIDFIIKALKEDLLKMELLARQSGTEPVAYSAGNTEECKKVSNDLIKQLEDGNYEIDAFQLGYLDTVLFNYYPKDIKESQCLINTFTYLGDLDVNPVYPVNSQEDLEKGFIWAKEEKKAIGIHIKMPCLEKDEVILNPYENLDKKLQYYKKAYNENLELNFDTDVKIVGYEIKKYF